MNETRPGFCGGFKARGAHPLTACFLVLLSGCDASSGLVTVRCLAVSEPALELEGAFDVQPVLDATAIIERFSLQRRR